VPKWFEVQFTTFREWECREGKKRWFIGACLYFYHITFSLVFFLPLSLFYLFFSLPCFLLPILFYLSFIFPPLLLFMATPFYTICHYEIYPFCPSTVFGFLWASLQECPLICWLSSHYFCPECAGCTALHFQTKLLVLFLTFLRFCFTSVDFEAFSTLTPMAYIKWS